MVLLHVKRGDESLFLYETTTQVPVSQLIAELVEMQNLRARAQRLISAVEDLVSYGVYKPEEKHGYTEEEMAKFAGDEESEKKYVERNGTRFLLNPDPTGRRCGEAPTEYLAESIQKECASAKLLLSSENITANRVVKLAELHEAINLIRAAITMTYPMGLPVYEPVKHILDDTEDLSGQAASKEVYDKENTCVWWASKELLSNKKLFEIVGKNEKTKLIVKIQKKGQGAPVREAPLSEQAQKNLMAYYFKKQEEEKKLLENNDDDYLNSPWANSKSLKTHFNGMASGVSWRPV